MRNTPGGINNRLDTREVNLKAVVQVIHNEIQRENKNLEMTTTTKISVSVSCATAYVRP